MRMDSRSGRPRSSSASGSSPSGTRTAGQPCTVQSREAVIDQLHKEKLSISAASRSRIEIDNRDVDAGFSGIASRMSLTAAQLTEALAGAGSSAQTVRQMIRAALAQGGRAS